MALSALAKTFARFTQGAAWAGMSDAFGV